MDRLRTLQILAKCLELASSDNDGEALAATRRANAIRKRLGHSWADMLGPAGTMPGLADPAIAWAQERSALLEEIARLERLLAAGRKLVADQEAELAGARAFAAELEYLLSTEQAIARAATERVARLEEESGRRSASSGRNGESRAGELRSSESRNAEPKPGSASKGSGARAGGAETDAETERSIEVAEAEAAEALRRGASPLPLVFDGSRAVILEIKPLERMFTHSALRMAEAGVEHARRMGADYALSSPHGVTLSTLAEYSLHPTLRRAMLAAVDRTGSLDEAGYRLLRHRLGVRTLQLGAIVLQEDLLHSRAPWRLSRLPDGESWRGLRGKLGTRV